MQLAGVKISIELCKDGEEEEEEKTLEEFEVEVDEVESCGSAYICSVDDAQFQIKLERDDTPEGRRDFRVKLTLDGQEVKRGMTWSKERPEVRYSSVTLSSEEVAPLKFLRIGASEQDAAGEGDSVEQAGTIEIRVWHARKIRKKPDCGGGFGFEEANVGDEALKQRKLEGGVPLTHRISLGEAKPATRRSTTCDLVGNDPIATFIYSYASRSVLEAMDVVPSAAVDEAIEGGGVPAEESNEELRRRVADLERQLTQVKREKSIDISGDTGPIDLTLDSDEEPQAGPSRSGPTDKPNSPKRVKLDPERAERTDDVESSLD
ncbi:uncharacterized protein PFL1_02647 [Pseudozyma flocculosa PF-1]|uniref:DUF7918 domain-containing protein n=1 Tax=Pseudozyma flocculosa PF-1 TaxID=1277687 RepID=A0A061HBX4_9BASI|nr:uncharacterized protein PFL1_02647 [Pseudozyma flocculosa PF-1]EPQ29974.1 hypothetical protein PFL1_02647 [Pseudozyma flocculosa PF-1]